MSKKDEVFRRYEKLAKAAKKENPGNASDHKPGSCAHCLYYRPDFKYRRCQFTRCPYGKDMSYREVRALIKDGYLEARQFGNKKYVLRDDLQWFLLQQKLNCES